MMAQVLATEFLKLRRSRVTWGTLGAFSMAPLGLALFMWIVREPERAAQFGLLGTKANLSGIEATWPSFLSMLVIVIGVGGMVLLAFIVAFVYGREYTESTAKNMLALPVSRDLFALAKLVVVLVWWIVLVVFVIAESFVDRLRARAGGVLGESGDELHRRCAACRRDLLPARAARRVGRGVGPGQHGADQLRAADARAR